VRVSGTGGRTTWARSRRSGFRLPGNAGATGAVWPGHHRVSDLQWTGGVETLNQFSDGYPSLVLGQPSLDNSTEAASQRHAGCDHSAFSANIVGSAEVRPSCC
jgi:hypothetical protein